MEDAIQYTEYGARLIINQHPISCVRIGKHYQLKHAHYLVKKNGIIIIDDTNFGSINKHVDLYLSTKKYIEVRVFKTYIYEHRIIQKIIN